MSRPYISGVRLRMKIGGEDIEDGVEVVADAELTEDPLGVIGRSVGKDQLAPG